MNGFAQRDWDRIEQESLTAIRRTWPVDELERMALEGHHTPVSGDSLHRP